jgi:hypothetical protein
VFWKEEDYDDVTGTTTTSLEEREVVHKSMKKCQIAASTASASSSQRSGLTGTSSSCQTYRTPVSYQGSKASSAMTLPLEEVPGCSTYMSVGEMTQEEKAKAYDAYVRGNNQSEKEQGCMVQNGRKPGKPPPKLPEEVVVRSDNELEEDDGSSTLVSILSPLT